MNTIFFVVLQVGLGFLASLVLPWWTVAIIAGIIGAAFGMKGWQSFLLGFLAGGLLWAGTAAFFDVQNEGVLSTRIAALFKLSASWQLIAVTGIIGGLVNGLGCLTGASLRTWLAPKKQQRVGYNRKRKRR